MIKPSTYIRLAVRAALRRRYGYAALRVLRRGVRRAVRAHAGRTFDVGHSYDGQSESERLLHGAWYGLQRLRRAWPDLDLEDPRADP